MAETRELNWVKKVTTEGSSSTPKLLFEAKTSHDLVNVNVFTFVL